jgi:hypothetical protein
MVERAGIQSAFAIFSAVESQKNTLKDQDINYIGRKIANHQIGDCFFNFHCFYKDYLINV